MLLAQLTDTHVVDQATATDVVVDNNQRLDLAVDRLNAETVQPVAVLATGDLTDNGSAVEMATLGASLDRLRAPVLALPGNHDLRESFRDHFDMPWADDDNLSWVVDLEDEVGGEVLTLIGLDTLHPGTHGGMFDPAREEWLGRQLDATADRPVAIAMHHPPFETGIWWMDGMGLEGRDRFAAVVADRPNLTRIFCGHLHRPISSTVAGVPTTTGISTIHHVDLDLDPDSRPSVIEDPAGYQLHQFTGGCWVSHIRFIDTGHQPIVPDWAENY